MDQKKKSRKAEVAQDAPKGLRRSDFVRVVKGKRGKSTKKKG